MKAILIAMAVLVAPVMAEDLNEFVGTTYNFGNAVFSGGRGVAITQNGLVVKSGCLFLITKGLYASCRNVYYGNGKLTTTDGFLSYGTDGNMRVRDGNYYSGSSGQTYIYESNSPE